MYASRLLETFEPLELRTGPLGAKYNLRLLPKDRHKVTKFINYWAPQGAQVSDQAYGYLIVTEGENFARFHSDIDESLDSLATLYGSGEKIWFFVRRGRLRCFLISRVLYISSYAALLQAPRWCYRAHWCQNFRDSITELSGCSKLFYS